MSLKVMSETPLSIQGPAPLIGADTVTVLREHGLTEEDIGALVALKVVGVGS